MSVFDKEKKKCLLEEKKTETKLGHCRQNQTLLGRAKKVAKQNRSQTTADPNTGAGGSGQDPTHGTHSQGAHLGEHWCPPGTGVTSLTPLCSWGAPWHRSHPNPLAWETESREVRSHPHPQPSHQAMKHQEEKMRPDLRGSKASTGRPLEPSTAPSMPHNITLGPALPWLGWGLRPSPFPQSFGAALGPSTSPKAAEQLPVHIHGASGGEKKNYFILFFIFFPFFSFLSLKSCQYINTLDKGSVVVTLL